jgi:hypothetical protein
MSEHCVSLIKKPRITTKSKTTSTTNKNNNNQSTKKQQNNSKKAINVKVALKIQIHMKYCFEKIISAGS